MPRPSEICSIQQRAWLRILVSFRGFTDLGEVMFRTSNQWPVVMWGSLNKTCHLGGGLPWAIPTSRRSHFMVLSLHQAPRCPSWEKSKIPLLQYKQKLIRVNDGNAFHQFEINVKVHDSEALPHKKWVSHSKFTPYNKKSGNTCPLDVPVQSSCEGSSNLQAFIRPFVHGASHWKPWSHRPDL